MGIYDRDYYRERKEGNTSRKIFKTIWYLILFLFLIAFAVYVLAILSE